MLLAGNRTCFNFLCQGHKSNIANCNYNLDAIPKNISRSNCTMLFQNVEKRLTCRKKAQKDMARDNFLSLPRIHPCQCPSICQVKICSIDIRLTLLHQIVWGVWLLPIAASLIEEMLSIFKQPRKFFSVCLLGKK